MATDADYKFYNQVGADRIGSRQIDELIGIARGLVADNQISQGEVEFLQKWLAANLHISDQPVIRMLYKRIAEMLADGLFDDDEKSELIDTLNQFSAHDIEGLGELLKSTTLPFDDPQPFLMFVGQRYCFTGTFNFGCRKECEGAVVKLGAEAGSLTKKTNVLVVGIYATDSWKHSSFGNKIKKACEWRDAGHSIKIVGEAHWRSSTQG
jgi:NAD-dependent DNA ligase